MYDVELKRLSPDVINYKLVSNETVVRDFNINLGYTYIIDPLVDGSNQTGRRCIILKFDSDEKATIKYVDNGRNGRINLRDLNVIDDFSMKIKLISEQLKKYGEKLIEALAARDELDRKIEQYRLEIIRGNIEIEKLKTGER